MKTIAVIRTDFPEKFAIPRQSGLAETEGYIVFEKEYASSDAIRGIEQYSHLWIIWKFSENEKKTWSPTVRPPRLGGNKRVGVFATRSPFRPNPIGLSSVRLLGVEKTNSGCVLKVLGADLMDRTPILDIKPYLAYTDSHPDATAGFADDALCHQLDVEIPDIFINKMEIKTLMELESILSQDPRPAYIDNPERVYRISYKNMNVKFVVNGNNLKVIDII